VDMNGGFIGITSFMVTEGGGSDGLGFALPSNLVQIIYQELKTRGHVRVGEIGIRVQNITSTLARGIGLSQDWGAVVSDVGTKQSGRNGRTECARRACKFGRRTCYRATSV